MPTYRFFAIAPGEHIAGPPEVIECKDDREAVVKATGRLDGLPIEIWQLDRFVTRLEPKG
jgi:hypothetical protein